MLKYNNQKFNNYIELQNYLIGQEMHISEKLFPHSCLFYIRAALQNKFPEKKFTLTEIHKMIKEEIALGNLTLKID